MFLLQRSTAWLPVFKAYQKCGKLLLMALLLHGCASPPPASGLAERHAWQPPETAEAWSVDTVASRLRVLVHRAGPLARFGHNHVIDFDLQGTLYRAAGITDSGFILEVPLDSAIVDPPAGRAGEGEDFPGTLSEAARRDTRSNMLGEDLLAAADFPVIRIESVAIVGSAPDVEVTVHIHVRDRVFERTLPARVDFGTEAIRVDAGFELTQSGLGLEQYSTLGGGLQVADRFTVKLQLLARRSGR